jgi:hypothetical protein
VPYAALCLTKLLRRLQVAPAERPPLLRPGMCFQGSQCNNRITDSSHNWSVAVRVEVTSLCLDLPPASHVLM